MPTSFDMGSACVLAQAEAHRDRLVAWLQDVSGDRATIDLSHVEEADISLVQLLLSTARTAGAKGVSLDILPSPASDAVFLQAGLPGWTADPRI